MGEFSVPKIVPEKSNLPEIDSRKPSRIKNIFNRRNAAAMGTLITAIATAELAVPPNSFAHELAEKPTPIVQQFNKEPAPVTGIQNAHEIITDLANGKEAPKAIINTSPETQPAAQNLTAPEQTIISEAEAKLELGKIFKIKGGDSKEEQDYKRNAIDTLAASNPNGIKVAVDFLKKILPPNLGEKGLMLYANQLDYDPMTAGGKSIEESLSPKIDVLKKLVNDGSFRQDVQSIVILLREEGYSQNFNISYMNDGLLKLLKDPNQRSAFTAFSKDDRSSSFLAATGDKYSNFKSTPIETNTAFQAWKAENSTK